MQLDAPPWTTASRPASKIHQGSAHRHILYIPAVSPWGIGMFICLILKMRLSRSHIRNNMYLYFIFWRVSSDDEPDSCSVLTRLTIACDVFYIASKVCHENWFIQFSYWYGIVTLQAQISYIIEIDQKLVLRQICNSHIDCILNEDIAQNTSRWDENQTPCCAWGSTLQHHGVLELWRAALQRGGGYWSSSLTSISFTVMPFHVFSDDKHFLKCHCTAKLEWQQ